MNIDSKMNILQKEYSLKKNTNDPVQKSEFKQNEKRNSFENKNRIVDTSKSSTPLYSNTLEYIENTTKFNIGNELPFILVNPISNDYIWLCHEDIDGIINSRFENRKKKIVDIKVLQSKQEAIDYRNKLLLFGWERGFLPDIVFITPDNKEITISLTN